MQGLYRDEGVDLSAPAHCGQLRGPIVGHEIGAPKLQHSAFAPLTGVCLEAAAGKVREMSRKIEAAEVDARQAPLKAINQKAGAAGQFNDPG